MRIKNKLKIIADTTIFTNVLIGVGSRIHNIANIYANNGFHVAVTYSMTRIGGIKGALVANLCNIGFECMQQQGVIPGSYDFDDIIAGTVGSIAAILVNKIADTDRSS